MESTTTTQTTTTNVPAYQPAAAAAYQPAAAVPGLSPLERHTETTEYRHTIDGNTVDAETTTNTAYTPQGYAPQYLPQQTYAAPVAGGYGSGYSTGRSGLDSFLSVVDSGIDRFMSRGQPTGHESFRSDPLGGYTYHGPDGSYEKKHKFTRRITRRGPGCASTYGNM